MLRKASLPFLVAVAAALIAGCGGGQQSEGGGGGDNAAQQEGGQEGGGQAGGEETTGGMEGGQLNRVEAGNPIVGTSYVSPLVEVFGDVRIGERSFVAGNTVLRAAPERTLSIGSETNAQDNIIARALDEDSTIGNQTSLAHHAIIRDSEIGDFAFVGFQTEIIGSTVENGALISAGALIENVTVAEDALVPPGAEITTQADADALDTIEEAEEEFKRAVLDVNAEFAENYVTLYEEEGYEAVIGVGPNPVTSFNPERAEPQIASAEVGEFARVMGDVQIGPNSEISERAAIRADEGSPIVIGANANIEERVTFHALEGTSIEVGDNLDAGDEAVLHGPLEVGNGLTVGDDSVVFRVIVEDGVTVGEEVVIQGPAVEEGEELSFTLPAGTIIPDGAVITDEASLQAVLNDQ